MDIGAENSAADVKQDQRSTARLSVSQFQSISISQSFSVNQFQSVSFSLSVLVSYFQSVAVIHSLLTRGLQLDSQSISISQSF